MRREELIDLNAFAMVAEQQSFTRAAAKLRAAMAGFGLACVLEDHIEASAASRRQPPAAFALLVSALRHTS